ncbi:cryptochrome/photolyase family protein [Azotobacter chroococcum]|uniref:Putative deoxyribodipyrimidine photolyase-related protein n=1 Tax=Azotobacter chroococcum NCIMB 8003 TaxID=1328314 RepID=A0A0C4WM37_9GAMM|nr:cryptochrome/photolyase family protein [Azotobacter chroococcum]AJE21434.1 putative deoxyribodipyrimidine photolyase-related protein [Azotobacter chroococcum NCIMB 8003]
MTDQPPPARRLALVLGDQLSFELASLRGLDPRQDAVLLAEVREEVTRVPYHPKKIALIFSAMRHFAEALRRRGFRVHYVTLDDPDNCGSLPGELVRWADRLRAGEVHLTECGDWRLEQSLCHCGLPLVWHADTRFLCGRAEFARWAADRQPLRMEFFYREMRRKSGLLLDADGAPLGGGWNYDGQGRKPLPAGVEAPMAVRFAPDVITREVLALVGSQFAGHPGVLDGFDYPVSHGEAQALWQHFLDFALPAFGDYQDAMASGEPFLFHARIGAALNIGLLDLRRLCADVEEACRSGRVSLGVAEGFIRQLIGWREYVRGIYWLQMPDYATRNAFGNRRPLPAFYWTGQTRMNCLRQTIDQTLKHAYAHHIQRLMVTGNFALLAGIAPRQVCDWYLAMYLDAFDWAALPNTLGMAMHADGGYLASKPCCASGQYIRRMSDYCASCAYRVSESTGEQACPFNALYWHFLMRHRRQLEANPRLGMVYRTLARMPETRQQALWRRGEDLLARLAAEDGL